MKHWVAALIVVAGAAVGVGTAIVVMGDGKGLGRQAVDGWVTNELAGSRAADPYSRASIARTGLLALNRGETIYFHKYSDEQGRAFRPDCVYEVRGRALPARWWSLTLYAEDDFLARNGDKAFSVDATRIRTDPSGGWSVRIGGDRGGAADWLSSRNAGTFMLSLRMYNPTAAAREHPDAIAFPAITTVSCGDA